MKKLLFTIIILFAVLSLHAQEQDEQEIKKEKNAVGIDIIDLFDGALQISYERMMGKHISVGLGLGYKGKEGIISLSGIDEDQLKTNDITYSGFKVIPEVRYYINSSRQYAMDGFYFGAYLKYTNYKSDLDGTYIDIDEADISTSYAIEFEAKFNTTSVGLMIGYKLPISKRLSIDFLIAGPGAGRYDFTLKNKRDDTPDEFYEDLNKALEEYSLLDYINGDFKFSEVDSKTDFMFPSFRYGISLGYSF